MVTKSVLFNFSVFTVTVLLLFEWIKHEFCNYFSRSISEMAGNGTVFQTMRGTNILVGNSSQHFGSKPFLLRRALCINPRQILVTPHSRASGYTIPFTGFPPVNVTKFSPSNEENIYRRTECYNGIFRTFPISAFVHILLQFYWC